MRIRISDILALLAVGLFPAVQGFSQEPDLSFLTDTTRYLWPTDASPYISSTFGETRAAHFHAGLDIRTWGREGYRVFATRDGIVSRLAISPRGYGKVVFLTHDDGSRSIYAHLNRFEDSLMALADSVRMQTHQFLLDLNLEEKQIRVRQGDLIAWTGSSGIGPPHLHFELRTPEGHPFNPLLTNLDVADDLPPVFTGLAVEHLEPGSYQIRERSVHTVSQQGNRVDFGTVDAAGPLGLAVNVHDRANRTPNRYAPYELALVNGADTLFYSRVDAFDYSDATQMFIDRVYPLLRDRYGGYHRLYLVNGNHLPFYKTGPTRGVIDLPEGDHDLLLTATDYYGNRTTGTLRLRVSGRTVPPAGRVAGIPAYPSGNTSATEMDSAIASADRLRQAKTVRKVLYPGQRQFLSSADRRIWIDFPPDALFDTLQVELEVEYEDGYPVIRFHPEQIPLRNPVRLNIILPGEAPEERTDRGAVRTDKAAGPAPLHPADHPPAGTGPAVDGSSDGRASKMGLYSRDRRENRHRFHGAARPGERVRSRIFSLQEYRFLNDFDPPWIGRPVLETNLAGMPVVHVPVVDEGSGLDYLRSTVRVNGEQAIVEYDPDKDRLTWYHPRFHPLPSNTVEVEAYDRHGNRSTRVFPSVR